MSFALTHGMYIYFISEFVLVPFAWQLSLPFRQTDLFYWTAALQITDNFPLVAGVCAAISGTCASGCFIFRLFAPTCPLLSVFLLVISAKSRQSAGLMNSYGNVTLTCQQSLHKSLKTATKSSASVGASDIASAAVWYSLAFNNLVYLVVFVLFA